MLQSPHFYICLVHPRLALCLSLISSAGLESPKEAAWLRKYPVGSKWGLLRSWPPCLASPCSTGRASESPLHLPV